MPKKILSKDMMIFDGIYSDVVTSFGSLWNYKVRENTLEIITPFATTSSKFVSVFLSKIGREFIVSDGGWVYEGTYGNTFDRDIDCYNKIFTHYTDSFSIKETLSQTGTSYFYKKTEHQISVPSLIFDMANFISSIVSASGVEYEKEKQVRDLFSTNASEYLKEVIGQDNLHVGAYLDSKKQVKPSAIINVDGGKVVLLNYITGSNPTYFRHSISGANQIFEMANEVKEKAMIKGKIALVDDTSNGYKIEKVSNWLNHMIKNTQSDMINWAGREKLKNYN